MKLMRVLYGVIFMILLVLALFSGRRELFILLCIMALVLVSSVVMNLWTAHSLRYWQELSTLRAVKGDTVKYKLRIVNEKPFPFTMMKVHVHTVSPSEKLSFEVNLLPKSDFSYESPLPCIYRGIYSIGMVSIEINDVFGMWHGHIELKGLSYYRRPELTIFPRIVKLSTLPAYERDSKYRTSKTSSISDSGDSFAALREYRPGDALKMLHWPTAVRRHEIMVRNFDTPTETSIFVFIDNSYDGFEGEDVLKYADMVCECAMAVANSAIASGYCIMMADAHEKSREIIETQIKGLEEISGHLARMDFPVKGNSLNKLGKVVYSRKQIKAVYFITGNTRVGFERQMMRHVPKGHTIKLITIVNERMDISESATPGIVRLPIAFGESISDILGETLWN